MPGRALAPEDLHPQQHGGSNLEMVYYQMDTDVNYQMNIDYRMTVVVNYRIFIEGNNSSNT